MNKTFAIAAAALIATIATANIASANPNCYTGYTSYKAPTYVQTYAPVYKGYYGY